MSYNIRILIKINYIYCIFYFIRQIISRTNPINSRFILIIHFYFKVSPALITPFPANIFPNILVPNVPYSILRNPPFCSFASSFIISLTSFNNNPESSRDLTICKMSSISSFEIIKVVL